MNNVKKIVIIGGESTGKSTLCTQLATLYNTVMVSEVARTYLEKLDRDYEYEDLLLIAKSQIALEEKMNLQANKFLFCDTDLQVIKIWSETKYKQCDPFIINEIKQRKYDGYIITKPDIAWEYDVLREHAEINMRYYFFNLYKSMVENLHVPYCIVVGDEKNRLEKSVRFLENKIHI